MFACFLSKNISWMLLLGPSLLRFGPLASPSFEVGRPSPQDRVDWDVGWCSERVGGEWSMA